MKVKEKYDCKLLVEGHNDQHVVWALCQCHKIEECFDVVDCECVDNLLEQFRLRLTIPETNKRLGVVIDADTSLVHRWRQFCDIIKRSGKYEQLDVLPKNGLIIRPKDKHEPIVGLWIMPNNQLNGMLEDFLSFLVRPDDVLMDQVEIVLEEIEKQEIHRYKDVHHAKAKIHTFLAWQEDPGTPMGQAITKKYLQPDCEMGRIFLDCLSRLYLS